MSVSEAALGEHSRPLVMGVVNVTPDSFSDGGRYLSPDDAIAHGMELFDEGADLIDVGGESTRPGADPVPADEELARVVPVIEALSKHGRISIDTRKAEVADAAIRAGATLLNDVSATLHEVAAAHPGVGFVAMHMLGDPRTMQDDPQYGDVVAEIRDFLVERAEDARAAGVREVWIDPGIGFGKTTEHNLEILRRLDELTSTGFEVLVATSRKRFLGQLLARSDGMAPGEAVATGDRLEGSVATAVWAMVRGARMVRVHDVRATVHAAKVVAG